MADVATADLTQKFTDLELEHPVDGDITIPGASDEETELTTLDEPVRVTVMRDAKAVGVKLFHVVYPKQSKALLKEWDLWGPLVLCTVFAILLESWSGGKKTAEVDSGAMNVQFSQVFALLSFGAIVVALNCKLLGGVISFFQCVCVLGYCILPLLIALVVCRIVGPSGDHPAKPLQFIIELVVVLGAFIWSTFASMAFLADSQPQHRKLLALYPIFLFYFVIGWLILSRNTT